MNTLGLPSAWRRAASALALAATLALPAALSAQSTADSRKAYDLPADNADKALRRFSEQAGIQVLFPTEITRDVRMDLPQNLGIGVANTPLMDGLLLIGDDVLYKLWNEAAMYNEIYDYQ